MTMSVAPCWVELMQIVRQLQFQYDGPIHVLGEVCTDVWVMDRPAVIATMIKKEEIQCPPHRLRLCELLFNKPIL
jgi:hypothetical protein